MITIAGNEAIHKAVWFYLREIFREDIKIVVVDGSNRFDPYLISKISVSMNLNPYNILENIFVARAFTPFQLFELLKRVYSFRLKDRKFIFILLGLTKLLDDDNISHVKSFKLLKKYLFYLSLIKGSIITINSSDRRNMAQIVEKNSDIFIKDNTILKPKNLSKRRDKIWAGQLHHLHIY